MRKQIYPALLLLLVSVVMNCGCDKSVRNIDLPSGKPKLVLGCFLSPQDTNITVSVTYSSPIFNKNNSSNQALIVTDAKVILSDGTNSITIPHDSSFLYESSAKLFPIIAGQTYYLTVSTPRGENVSAACTVPVSNISNISIDYIDTLATSKEKKISIKWNDISNETNYYQVVASIYSNNTNDYYAAITLQNPLQNDVGKEGKVLATKMKVHYRTVVTKIGYIIYILNINAEYYKYQYSLNNYNGDDPFLEPSPIYTNIKNGLGIFAAYQKYYKAVP